jgi:hypothetical protein
MALFHVCVHNGLPYAGDHIRHGLLFLHACGCVPVAGLLAASWLQ